MDKDLSKGLRPSKQAKGEILFGTFEFREIVGDENVSVRRGVKWYNARGRYIAKPSDKKDKREQPIDIHQTEVYKFKDIPAKILYYEHQKDCETYDGLLKTMFTGYGATFSEEEYVTVVWFRLVT